MFICKECLGEFSTKSNLKRHLKTEHGTNFKGFKCLGCRKVFTRKSQENTTSVFTSANV